MRTSRAVSRVPAMAAGDSDRSARPGTISLMRRSIADVLDWDRPAMGECLLLLLLLPLTLCTRTLRTVSSPLSRTVFCRFSDIVACVLGRCQIEIETSSSSPGWRCVDSDPISGLFGGLFGKCDGLVNAPAAAFKV